MVRVPHVYSIASEHDSALHGNTVTAPMGVALFAKHNRAWALKIQRLVQTYHFALGVVAFVATGLTVIFAALILSRITVAA